MIFAARQRPENLFGFPEQTLGPADLFLLVIRAAPARRRILPPAPLGKRTFRDHHQEAFPLPAGAELIEHAIGNPSLPVRMQPVDIVRQGGVGPGVHGDIRRKQAFRLGKAPDPPRLTGFDGPLRQHRQNRLGMNGGHDPGSPEHPSGGEPHPGNLLTVGQGSPPPDRCR